MSAVPVHVVVGAGASELIARSARDQPDLLGFVRRRAEDLPNLVLSPAGCPCCTARVAMQVALARELRVRRPARVYMELPDEAHAAELTRALAQWPLSQYVAAADTIRTG